MGRAMVGIVTLGTGIMLCVIAVKNSSKNVAKAAGFDSGATSKPTSAATSSQVVSGI